MELFCARCRKEITLAESGKLRGYLYCQPCCMVVEKEKIGEWGVRYMAVKRTMEKFDVNKLPRLSEFIT